MNLKIALFGSFRDSNGYTWRLPDEITQKQLQEVTNLFLKTYDDGRRLPLDEIYGGYFLDATHQMFYAFRFIDGGRDSRGREGVVITNWAVAPYASMGGKNIRSLYDRLTFSALPNPSEIIFSDSFEFIAPTTTLNEGVLSGDKVFSIFNLPTNIDRNSIVQFELKGIDKAATIKFISTPFSRTGFSKAKTNTMVQEKKHPVIVKKNSKKLNRFSIHIACTSILFVAFILFGIGLWPNKSKKTEVDSQKEQLNINLQSEDASQTAKDASSYVSTRGNDSNEDDIPSVSSFFYKYDVNSFAIYVIAKESCVWKDIETNNVASLRHRKPIECGKTDFDLVIDKSVLSLQFYYPTPISGAGSSDNHDPLCFYIDGIDDEKYILTVTDSSWEIRVDKRFKHTGESPLSSTYSNLTRESESYSLRDKNDLELAQLLIESNRISFKSDPSIPATFVRMEEDNLLNFGQTISFASNVFFVFFKVDTHQSTESLDLELNSSIDNGGTNE